jgi:outer membrane protein assembly factor BamB
MLMLACCGGEPTAPQPQPKPSIPTPTAVPVVSGFRGDGTGVFPKVDPTFTWDDKKNVKWRARAGSGYSSPVLCKDSVFVTSNPAQLCCINAATGEIQWKAQLSSNDVPDELKEKVKHGEGAPSSCGLAAPTPVCDGQHVFVAFGSGAVACYSLDGKREWLQYIAPGSLQYGHSSSPLLVDGILIVNLKHLMGLDPATGKISWECPSSEQYYGTPASVKAGNTWVVVTPLGLVVRSKDGTVLAKAIAEDLGGDEYGISPTVSGDVVYVGDRMLSAIKLEFNGEALQPKKLWSSEMSEGAFASPLVANGLLFYLGKHATYSVLDAANGTKALEQPLKLPPAEGEEMGHGDVNVYPSIVMAGGKLFMGNDIGQVLVVEPTKEYKETARNQFSEGSGSTPAFSGTSMFIRAGEYLYCIGK